MVEFTLYGSKKATCTQRVLILLEELELKYDFKEIDLAKGEQKSEEYLKLSPFGKVPVIVLDDQVIFESRTILRYISKNNTEDFDLTLNNNVNVDMWLEVEAQNFNPLVSKIVYETVFKKWQDQETDNEVVQNTLVQLRTVFDVCESRLSTSKYMGGNMYSIADISYFPYLHYMVTSGSKFKTYLKEYPRFYHWYKKMLSRQAIKTVLNLY